MSIYISDSDEAGSGKSNCIGDCAKRWPPVAASADELSPPWGAIERDGGRQLTYRGKPVHTHARDAYPGATFGDGNGWHVAFEPIATPPGIAITNSLLGQVLATAQGLTLYSQDDGAPSCTGMCLDQWAPAAAPWAAGQIGDFTVIDRGDGIAQWAFRGKPVFAFAGDVKPGDVRGQSAAWRPAVLEPAPPRPDWVTVVGSDAGALLADAKGMTIYAYDEDRNHLVYVRGEDCFGPCIAEMWAPVLAESQTGPIGNWSVIQVEGGQLQWAHKGQPLYTSKLENRPGDLSGISQRRARAWRPIMYAIPSIQGASPNG